MNSASIWLTTDSMVDSIENARVALTAPTAWVRNRTSIVISSATSVSGGSDGEVLFLEDLLPSPWEGPDAAYARTVLLEELDTAIEELPDDQREVFVAHEIEGRSFKELAAETGVSVNTLLSRKHYAVLHLRRRLQAIYDEFRGK